MSESLRLAHEAREIECEEGYRVLARREIRQWIRQELILEREGRLIATDALEATFRFVDGLDNRIMTSTASQLSIVQREIESLEFHPDPDARARLLKDRIAALEAELVAAEQGEVGVLSEQAAVEVIREVYALSMGLRNDLMDRPELRKALNRDQRSELRWLVMRLVDESAAVIEARARGERDLKGFLRTGLASEHHRVGQLLNEILAQAAAVDWSRQALRRSPGPLPPVGFPNGSLPLVERLRFKDLEEGIRPTWMNWTTTFGRPSMPSTGAR